MPKYFIFASETVYYMKEAEAESEKQIRDMIYNGEIDFDYGDITDGGNFEISEIEEAKRYA